MNRRAFLARCSGSFAVVAGQSALSAPLNALTPQQKYAGPRPPKSDVPYLLEAGKLIQTELQPVAESKSKANPGFSVAGTTSTARTPLPEPVFLFAPAKLSALQLTLYRFEVKDGRRETAASSPSPEDAENQQNLHLTLRQVDQDLYRIEASHMLAPGEYALSTQGYNTAFCFTVY